jgi:hypothetical protein
MGCDIHLITEIKIDNKWILFDKKIFTDGFNNQVSSPFNERNYRVFALLANVRNDYGIKPISPPKGLPDDSEFLNFKIEKYITRKDDIFFDSDYHHHSHLTLKEFLEYDYSKIDNKNSIIKFPDEYFYENLELLKTLGEPDNVRIVFWFDN